jgi:hypothetical protein
MAVRIGTLTLTDAWIRNKWGGRADKRRLLTDKVNSLVLPPCGVKMSGERPVAVAIDGTEYYARCVGWQQDKPPTANLQIVSPSVAKPGDIVFIAVEIEGCVFRAIDVYGRTYSLQNSETLQVQVNDSYEMYVMKYRFCGDNGMVVNEGLIEIPVETQLNDGYEKEIVINTCTSAQARVLGLMLGTRVDISDEDVSFPDALIVEVNLEYIATDMVDTATRNRQGVDIYKGTVRFRVKRAV